MHLFRPVDSPANPSPPVGVSLVRLLVVVARSLLARGTALFHSDLARVVSVRVLLLVGLVVQGALILLAGYLVDLSVSLMEIWAELARKHLELTL